MGYFWAKHMLFELKKYRGVNFNETEYEYKIWSGIDLLFQKWHKEFDKSWPEHSKVSKIFTLMDFFWAKCLLFKLKKYRGVIFHDSEEICKFWKTTGLWFEKRLRNKTIFHQSTWKCQNWDFDRILLWKIEKVWRQTLQRSNVSWQWKLMQNLTSNWLVIPKVTILENSVERRIYWFIFKITLVLHVLTGWVRLGWWVLF